MRQAFLMDICNQLDAFNLSSENPEENWTVVHKTVHSSAATTLSKKAAYSNFCKTVQTKLMDMQDFWLKKKTEEMKKFHDALKTFMAQRVLEPPHCSV